MTEHELSRQRVLCCESLEKAFVQIPIPSGAKKPLGEELSREIFRHLRRHSNESLPFYLSEILAEITRKPDRAMINDMIEYLDFNLSAAISDSEHKEIWGEEGLEAYKQTNQKHLEDNNQIALLLSKEQASAILCWLKWVNESSEVDEWRKEQLKAAIKYWASKAEK